MNNLNNSKPTRLSKVYFTCVIRDYGTAEWFHSLLHAIETQDTQNRIEINIYLTQRLKEDEMNNIIVRFPPLTPLPDHSFTHAGTRRRRREGRNHLPARPNTLWPTQLRSYLQLHRGETPRIGRRCGMSPLSIYGRFALINHG